MKIVKALDYFMKKANVKTAHKEVVSTNKHLESTWQRRCCGEQGEKILSKSAKELKEISKHIDHSFYRGLIPLAAMVLADEEEISNRFESGGLPAAGNSSDHIYLCVEYKMDDNYKFKPNDEKSALEESEKEKVRLEERVNTLEKEAAAKAASGTTAGTPTTTTVTTAKEDEGMLAKVKNFFYTSGGEKKLDWKKVVPTVGLGLGAVAAVAGAGVKMGVLGQEEKGMSGMAKAGIAAAALAGVGAAAYGYKKYKAGHDDSEVDDADREVSLGEAKKNKKNRKNKGKKDQDEKSSNKMLLIFGGLAVLAAVVAFLFLGKAEKKSASPLEGDELV